MPELKTILEEIGLTGKESEVYLALLKSGEETASRISEVAELNRITTYTILKSLSEKGFCSVYDKNNVQYFKPIKPEQILGLLEEKKKKIRAIMPMLKEQEKVSEEKPEVSLFQGKKGMAAIMALLLEDAEHKKEVLGYGNVSIAEQVIEFQSLYWRKTRLEKKIYMRAVSDSMGDIEHRSPPEWKKLTQVRTNKDFSKIKTYVIISENFVGEFILAGELFAILKKSKDLADKEKHYFEMLWKQAK